MFPPTKKNRPLNDGSKQQDHNEAFKCISESHKRRIKMLTKTNIFFVEIESNAQKEFPDLEHFYTQIKR